MVSLIDCSTLLIWLLPQKFKGEYSGTMLSFVGYVSIVQLYNYMSLD